MLAEGFRETVEKILECARILVLAGHAVFDVVSALAVHTPELRVLEEVHGSSVNEEGPDIW